MSSAPSESTATAGGRTSRAGLRISLRLSLYYAAFFVIGYLAVIGAAQFLIRTVVAMNEREIVAARITEYRAWFVAGSVNGLRSRFEEQSRRSADLMFVRILGPGTDALLFNSPSGRELLDVAKLDEMAASGESVVATLVTSEPMKDIWTVGSTALPRGYFMQAGKVSTSAFRAVNLFRNTFLWLLIPVTLVALLGGVMLSYRAMKPARDLTATARTIVETGRLGERVPENDASGELAEMGRLVNRMLDRNQALIDGMKDALDNVSHDLRTPMTRLRATAESALANPEDPAASREALADCLEESDRVLAMLNTLMDIAEAETGVMQLHRERVDLNDVVDVALGLYELVAEEKGITFTAAKAGESEVVVDADRARLQQVVANLVDNALKHGREGGSVKVETAREGDQAVIRVIDDGPGIAEEDLPRIWERLYRGDRSRSQRGLGLGLSLVRAIVDAHGGSVEAVSEPGSGAAFVVRLPG